MTSAVSVIIPAFNAEKYIEETLDSIFSQGHPNLEVVVIDDGSTDRTGEIVRNYREPVKYIRQGNQGPSKARNTGIEQSKGEYIAFLDADDLWTEDKLKLQIGFLESHPEVGMVFSDMLTFNEKGIIEPSYLRKVKRKHFYETLSAEQEALKDPFQMLLVANFIPTGSVVLRRSCLEEAGLFDESISSVEDLDMWMRVSIFHKVGFIPRVLKKKRDHENNISKDHYKAYVSAIYVREKLQKLFPAFTNKYKRGFDSRLSKLYFGKGWGHFSRSEMKEARADFVKSFSHKKSLQTLLYASCCFLPGMAIRLIRKIKQSMGR